MTTDTMHPVDPGARPAALAAALPDNELRQRLLACMDGPYRASEFSIAHRGAPLGYPEHTREGYIAAARMGAGAIECDVTFTKDGALVCRHSQCDLHRTTNILTTPLANKCSAPFAPARNGQPATAKCCTTDITLAEFQTLCGRRDVVDTSATDIDAYLRDPGSAVIETPMSCGTLVTHAQSIRLIDELGANFIPELKSPEVPMPHQGMDQAAYASRMLEEYASAGIEPTRVRPQSFRLQDLEHWIARHPEFAANAIYLDARGRQPDFKPSLQGMQRLREAGINILAPPMPMLLVLDEQGELLASDYARFARQAGLEIITWTFESGDAADPDNWIYGNLPGFMSHESRMLEVLHALHTQVGILGIFSDWPGTVTFYANCFGL
jgi:glycerophosphoryl diester phosphodiesterase